MAAMGPDQRHIMSEEGHASGTSARDCMAGEIPFEKHRRSGSRGGVVPLSPLRRRRAAGFGAARPADVGIAFGGGSARGIAHIGVIQWFEEHHIPIDMAAGTSMGGLVGGAFATGMSAAELRALIVGTDWDVMFGSSSFQFKNVRRKEDARSYPSQARVRVEGRHRAAAVLNDGQQVDLLLARVTAPYYAIEHFDELPTPFRVVAVDLRAGEKVVIESGSLATALRATMSLPAVFPPVEREGRVLVDGGALDNIPADVVRGAGTSVVIAIDVGYEPDRRGGLFVVRSHGPNDRRDDALRDAHVVGRCRHDDCRRRRRLQLARLAARRRADRARLRGGRAAARRAPRYRASDADWQAWLSLARAAPPDVASPADVARHGRHGTA